MEKVISRIENTMIYMILVLSFLLYSSVTQNTRLISFLIWPIVCISGVCVLYRLFNLKKYNINSLHKYLVLFILSYIISCIINIKYGYYQNFRTIVLMILVITLIFTKPKEENEKLINRFLNFFVVFTTVLSICSLLVFNYSQIFIGIGNKQIYLTGLRWGRLRGFYNDFNYGAIVNVFSILISIYLYNKNKKKILYFIYVMCDLINFSFIALSDSRSSLIALMVCISMYMCFIIFSRKSSAIKKIIEIIIIVSLIFSACWFGKIGVKSLFSIFYDNEEEKIIINTNNGITVNKEIVNKETNDNNEVIDTKEYDETDVNKLDSKKKDEIENKVNIIEENIQKEKKVEQSQNIYYRGYSTSNDISNRRFDLWKSAIEIYKTSPIFGVSFENVEEYCYKNVPNTYLLSNGYREFDNFHNIIFNILVSQGIVGIVILVWIVIYITIDILLYSIEVIKESKKINRSAFMISCFFCGIISTLFIGDIVYYISPSTIIFWFILGLLMNEINNYTDKFIWKVLKKIYRISCVKFFNIFPIKNNKIVFSNFSGKGYGDNSKYILEEINKRKLKCDLVWVLKDKKDKEALPLNVRYVKYNSIKYFYDMCTAKVWVDNHRKIIDFNKRKEQYYIQTWHGGIAFKKIEKDAEDSLDQNYIKQAKHDSQMIDLMVSNSTFCTKMFKKAFWYNGEILECGSPRNDILINNEIYKSKNIKDKLKISNDIKIILYAPTFRKDEGIKYYNINFEKLVKELNEKYNKEWIVLLRLHPNIAHKSKELCEKASNNIIDVSNYGDMYELMLISDILITDYSSVMFEFSFASKPVFLYANDLDEYIKDRGFYFDYNDLPYTIANNNEELINNITNFDNDIYQIKLKEFFDKIGLKETGKASKEVVNVIEKEIEGE